VSHHRYLILEMVRVTEAAALAAARWVGRGNKEAADQAAVDAMRTALSRLDIDGTVVIGEGEQDEAPMLHIGERVGALVNKGGTPYDIAVDPLDGTTLTAKGGSNATAVIAMTTPGGFLHAPDMRMEKIAIGPMYPAGTVSLHKTPDENLRALAKAKGCDPSLLTVCMLERERHKYIVDAARKLGTRIHFINDCDISAAVATTEPDSGIDIYMGSGGAPEGVLAAAALRCLGGTFEGRLMFENEALKQRASTMGITDFNRVYTKEDLAAGDVMFAATGVTDGAWLRGVRFLPNEAAKTHSVVMRSNTGTIRHIEAYHDPRKAQAYKV
jgi:fructose-1,6-bisphosphatase II / sedoheptulose-1,7-bisphosphatase